MILDSQGQFSDSQAETATAVSTNVVDLGIDNNVGIGEPMGVLFNVEVAADATTGDETYEFQIQSGSTATPTDVIAKVGFGGTNELAETTLAQGYKFVLPIPKGTSSDRYLRINYVLGGTTPSITISAHLVPLTFADSVVDYASGYTVS